MLQGVCNAILPALAVTRLWRLVRCGVHMRVRGGEASGSNVAYGRDYGILAAVSWDFQSVQTGLMSGSWIQPKATQGFCEPSECAS